MISVRSFTSLTPDIATGSNLYGDVPPFDLYDLRFLIVDDSRFRHLLIKNALTGFQITKVNDVVSAMDAFQALHDGTVDLLWWITKCWRSTMRNSSGTYGGRPRWLPTSLF